MSPLDQHRLGRRGRGSVFEQEALGRRPTPVARPPELEELERTVGFATEAAGDVHRRLRPVLRSLAAHQLRRRRGIDLEADPDAARRLLGAELYDLVRADRPAPVDRRAPGIAADHLAELVVILEGL
ncbi:MAG TPA: hypothetical protein VGM93_06150 [Acidimicrobiales bacterium]